MSTSPVIVGGRHEAARRKELPGLQFVQHVVAVVDVWLPWLSTEKVAQEVSFCWALMAVAVTRNVVPVAAAPVQGSVVPTQTLSW